MSAFYDYFGRVNEDNSITGLEIFTTDKEEELGTFHCEYSSFVYLGSNISLGIEPDDIKIGDKANQRELHIVDNQIKILNPLDFNEVIEVEKQKDIDLKNNIVDFFINTFSAYPKDRSRELEDILPCEDGFEIAKELDKPTTFDDAVSSKIKEIKECGNTNICLMWSGGIDSTLVFYELVNADIEFTLCHSVNSRTEYPMLYNEIIGGKFKQVIRIVDLEKSSSELDGATIITGEIGDQLVGNSSTLPFSYSDRTRHYKQVLDNRYIYPFEMPITKMLGTKDLTTAEYLWALNFIFKYVNVINRMDTHLINTKYKQMIHFFHNDDFQRWSVQNYKSNTNFLRERDYKHFYKERIFSYNGDNDYRRYKKKNGSLNHLLTGEVSYDKGVYSV